MTPTNPSWLMRWRAFTHALYLVRFNLLMLAAGYILLSVGQGRDVLIALAEDSPKQWLAVFGFFCAATYWGFSVWLWARTMLDTQFPNPPEHRAGFNLWRRHMPRTLGLLAFIALAHALWLAHDGSPAETQAKLINLALIALLIGALFWIFAYSAYRASGRIAERFGEGFRIHSISDGELPPFEHVLDALCGLRGVFVILSMLLGTGLFFASWLIPVQVGTLFGAIALFMIWAGSWLPIGSAITAFSSSTGFPLLAPLLLGALLFSFWNDNHEITHLDEAVQAELDPATRPDLDAALQAWTESQPENGSLPLVMVATAGGGIRAAYWTATILGELQDRTATDPRLQPLDRQLFALSGVSGGSVGSAVYRAVLSAQRMGKLAGDCKDVGVRRCAQRVLSHDLLGPAAASLLYPDMAQRFLPLPIMHPDRGRALEMSWEQAFRDSTGTPLLGQSLLNLYREEGRQWPALLLNATWVANGRRIVASNLKLDDRRLPVTEDQLTILGRDLPLSTAAHNSARFPGVSPAGMWKDPQGEIAGRLVDGGYFENYGAATALEILRVAKHKLGNRILPVVIAISSDPSLPRDVKDLSDTTPLHWAYEIRSPARAMFRTRGARGVEAIEHLKDWTLNEGGGVYAYFRMCSDDQGEFDPPLGWALSAAAREVIDSYLPSEGNSICSGNEKSRQKVLDALKKS